MDAALDILLVDDNPADRVLVRELLPPGWRTRDAISAREAGEALAFALPDVALLDYRLPDANGVSLVPTFVMHGVPVVMLTGTEAPEVIVEAMQAGAQDYLVKNHLNEEVLLHAVTNALEKERLRRAVASQQAALAEQAVALEAKNREISALAGALTLAEQAERRRLADLLHDELQQMLFGALLSVQMAGQEAVPSRSHLASAEQILEQAIQTTRDLAVSLTPPVLDREELAVSLRWLAHHMGEMHRLQVEVEAECEGRLPARELRVLLLQLARELLFNVVKHAGVREARIELGERRGHYAIAIVDEGCGFDPEAQRLAAEEDAAEGEGFPRGFGIYSVRERLRLLGGQLHVDSAPGRGTRVTISVPRRVGEHLREAAEPLASR